VTSIGPVVKETKKRGSAAAELLPPEGFFMPPRAPGAENSFNTVLKRMRTSQSDEDPGKIMKGGLRLSNTPSSPNPDARGGLYGEIPPYGVELVPTVFLSPASSISSLSVSTPRDSSDSSTIGTASTAVSPISWDSPIEPYERPWSPVTMLSPRKSHSNILGEGDIPGMLPGERGIRQDFGLRSWSRSQAASPESLNLLEEESINEFLAGCFNGPGETWRKETLERIRTSSFIREQVLEPVNQGPNDPYTRGHGKKDLSIYEVFVEGSSKEGWKCLMGSEERPCRAKVVFKRFERALEHIRSHLNHRPYKCDGRCGMIHWLVYTFVLFFYITGTGWTHDVSCSISPHTIYLGNMSLMIDHSQSKKFLRSAISTGPYQQEGRYQLQILVRAPILF
jgi:hypothetical protein